MLLLAGIAAAPILSAFWPAEAARWAEARAIDRALQGDTAGAVALLSEALQEYPENVVFLWRRGVWRMELEDYDGALEDLQKAAELEPDNFALAQEEIAALQHLGRHDEAIEKLQLWREKEIIQARPKSRAIVLNALAYIQAVGDRDLEEALEHVEEAIRIHGATLERLDTRGYIHSKLGNVVEAHEDLEKAVAEALKQLELAQRNRVYVDADEYAELVHKIKKNCAILIYHRMLLHAKNHTPAAEQDRKRIIELGFEPNEHLF